MLQKDIYRNNVCHNNLMKKQNKLKNEKNKSIISQLEEMITILREDN
jgi:hypothetical protein